MYNDIIRDIISHKFEEEWFELKSNIHKDDYIGEYISALSNGAAYVGRKTAYMIWGINDSTHAIEGTTFNPYCNTNHNEPLIHYLARKLEPSIKFEFKEAEYENQRLVLLIIDAAEKVPTSFDGVRYIRIGSSKEKLSKYPNRESQLFHILRDGQPTIVNTVSEYQNLTFNKLFVYYASKGIVLKEETFRQNLRLLTEDGKYNIQAQLLSDNSQMPIRVSIFDGETKASNLFSVREFGFNCLLYSLDEILRYGDVLNIIQADERNRVVERKDIPLFENKPFIEAIINAFVHNKWIQGYPPMISVFSNRIEILSRGGLPADQTLEGFYNGESKPVNMELAKIFLQLHLSEQSGRGVTSIINAYGKEAFEFREDAIVVKIPFNKINEVGNKVWNKVGNKDDIKLTINRKKIIVEIRNNPNVTSKQLAIILGISETAVEKNIKYLRENEYIERIGSNKTGFWKVIK